jgi:hypothetical protein
MIELAVIILVIALVLIVAVRCATANFKRLRMGCFFDLQARDLPPKAQSLKPKDSP